MSNEERQELSRKLHYGLALAERRMLEEKALRNEEENSILVNEFFSEFLRCE